MCTILIVDDEESIRWSFMIMLQKAGYRVFTAKDYTAALDLLEQVDTDVVVSDILLPGRSGLDILQWLKKKGRTLPVILITGQPDMETVEKSCRLGAFEYLAKPLRRENLLQVVELALKQRDLIRSQTLLDPKEVVSDSEVLPPLASALQVARSLFDRELLARLRSQQKNEYKLSQLAEMFDKSPLAVAFTDGDDLPYINDSFTRLTGYTLQDLPSVSKAFELFYPDTEMREQAIQARIQAHESEDGTDSEPVFQRFPIRTKDGQTRVLAMCGIFFRDGKALYSFIEVY